MTAHGTNTRDIQALVYLTRRLRDETYGAGDWHEAGIAAKLSELAGQNLASVVERVLCHATDPEAKTPGALHRPFLPPKPSERGPQPFSPPKRDEACRTCGNRCPGRCVRDGGGPEQPVAESIPPLDAVNPNLAARLRKAIEGADA